MNASELLEKLLTSVGPEEWTALEQGSPDLYIGDFNRQTILSMRNMQKAQFSSRPVDVQKIQHLSLLLEHYLKAFMPDRPEGHKWIILPCLYLAFVENSPMHPREAAKWECVEMNGTKRYFCPSKTDEEWGICDYCVCSYPPGQGRKK